MCPSLTSATAGATVRRRSPITQPGYRLGLKPPNAGKTYPAEVFTPDEILRLLEAWPLNGPHRRTGVRDRALTVLLWRSGLRIAEALALEPKDVDLVRGKIAVLRGKGAKRRTVPLDRAAAAFLTEWIDLRAELLLDRGDPELAGPTYGPLFCVATRPSVGRPLKDSCFREALKHRARVARLDRRTHPHAFRHTFTSEIYFVEGAQMSDLQLALGHRHASTTDRYVHRIAGSRRLHELLRERPWPT
jgi:site-specific recombinase XerD